MDGVMKWLEDNPVGVGLGIACALLSLILVSLLVLSSLPVSPLQVSGEADASGLELELPQLAENKPIDSYYIITQRPLFNETRQPGLDQGSGVGELLPEEMVDAPEVELAGVVITPTLRMVTLKRKDDERSFVAFEGKPIEADFGSWQISSIQERAATMTSGAGEELQLEMKVHDAEIAQPESPPAKNETAKTDGQATAVEEAETEQLSRAEEIRQRIAERREELRREAEQNGQDGGESNEPANYKSAIQAMIGRNRQNQTNKDNDQ